MKSMDNIDFNRTLYNLLNDCNQKIHFTEKFLNDISYQFNGQFILILKDFNQNFQKEFEKRISIENFYLQLDLVQKFSQLTNLNPKYFFEINQILKEIIENKFYFSNQLLIESIEQVKC